MAKAIRARQLSKALWEHLSMLMAPGAKIFAGTFVAWDLEKQATVQAVNRAGLIFVGIAAETKKGDGREEITLYRRGVFEFEAVHKMTRKDMFRRLYIFDNQTVGTLDDNLKGPYAGQLVGINPDDPMKIWIDIDPGILEGRRD